MNPVTALAEIERKMKETEEMINSLVSDRLKMLEGFQRRITECQNTYMKYVGKMELLKEMIEGEGEAGHRDENDVHGVQ